ncbi:MAG: hypothetical protein WBD31_14335 [Rubripirellula sp.]
MNSSQSAHESQRQQTGPVAWCLRLVVLVQCIGVGGRYLLSSVETESDVYGWLYFDLHWPEALSQTIDDTGMTLTLGAAVVLGITGWCRLLCDQSSIGASIAHRLDQAALLWVAAWMIALSIADMARAAVYGELALAEHAVRYAAPLALLMLTRRNQSPPKTLDDSHNSARYALTLLVIAASATFVAHGYKAIDRYAPFTDLILLSDLQWTGFGLSQSTAERVLVIIGAVDGIIAIALVAFRLRFAAAYMGVWGVITAASRMSALGYEAWPETVLRAANGGVPLAILLFLIAQNKSTSTKSE